MEDRFNIQSVAFPPNSQQKLDKLKCFSSIKTSKQVLQVNVQRYHMNNFYFITYPTKPQELAPVCADISECVTHRSWNCNVHFDEMHFIFSCVISNRCLRVLISVPRSLLLLTWETDTFLNACNCLGKWTWTLDLPCSYTGFPWEKLHYTKVLHFWVSAGTKLTLWDFVWPIFNSVISAQTTPVLTVH